MEMQMKMEATGGDRLSELPDSILIHILSMLWDSYEVVRTSVLSKRWRFLWMSVPVSLEFEIHGGDDEKVILDFHKELHYWRSCEKIGRFSVSHFCYDESCVQEVDLLVRFATKLANVEEFKLEIEDGHYKFPQFAYKSTSLRNLNLSNCQLNPYGSVNWTSLVSLSFKAMNLTDGLMEKVLSGCPSLECLELQNVSGIHRLEITSLKLRELIIDELEHENRALSLEIVAPYLQKLELLNYYNAICIQLRNVASLVTAVLGLDVAFNDEEGNLEKECRYWKELLHSVAHVKNLELGHSGIEFLSILELRGWQSPPSSRKFLELAGALEQSDFPGICSFLQSSPDLETLVINWDRHEPRHLLSQYTNKDEQNMRFETHNFNFSLPHLRTIQIINFHGPLSGNKFILSLVKYFLKNATVLEKFVLVGKFKGRDVSQDHSKMAQELLSFPRSSPHASVVFPY